MKFVEKCRNIIKFASICLLIFCSVFLVSCKDNKNTPPEENRVASISLSEEFISHKFYKDDFVDFSSYDITINYTKSPSVVLKMNDSNIKIDNFSTKTVGTHKSTISYAGISVFFYYTILDIEAIGLFYNGSTLTIYGQEEFDFSNVYLDIVYNNGNSKQIAMNLVSISGPDKTCSLNTKTLTASYLGFNVNVSYIVTNRKVEETKMYKFEDKSGLFDSSLKYVMKSGESFIFYKNTDGEIGLQTNLNSSDFNTFEVSKFANRELKTFVFTLVNDTIICKEKAL